MIQLYGRQTSFNVQKVLWILEELNLQFEHIEIGGKFGGLNNEAFKQLTPIQKIPLLIDGDKVIWESHTILRYLIAQYGDENWYTEDAYLKSKYERWMDWSQSMFQPDFMKTFWGYYRMPEHKRDMKMVNQALEKCKSHLQSLEKVLNKNTFLTGEKITLADICVGAVLYRLTTQGLDITLPKQTNKWYQLLKTRKGYQKWIMSDYSELKGREDF